jgi:K+-transporting ATPase KdpF subunit
MMDIVMIAIGFVFFALSIGYVYACDRHYSLAALVTVGLLIYLTYALLRPEQF